MSNIARKGNRSNQKRDTEEITEFSPIKIFNQETR